MVPTASKDRMDDRGRSLMKAVMEALSDPDTDRKLEEHEERHGRRQELIILGFRASRNPDDAKEVHLADLAEFSNYLRAWGSKDAESGIALQLVYGEATHPVLVEWTGGAGEVRFTGPGGVSVVKPATNDGFSSRLALQAIHELAVMLETAP